MMRTKILFIASFLVLSGCATLSEEECLSGNWYGIGYGDGAEGKPANRFQEHNKACANHGIPADFGVWRSGYDEGLELFCTADNGAWSGATGRHNGDVCTGQNGEIFQSGYLAGRAYYDLKQTLQRAESDYEDTEHDLDDLQRRIYDEEAKAKDTSLSQDERNTALSRIRKMEREYGREEHSLRNIERAVDELERDLDYLGRQLRTSFPGMKSF